MKHRINYLAKLKVVVVVVSLTLLLSSVTFGAERLPSSNFSLGIGGTFAWTTIERQAEDVWYVANRAHRPSVFIEIAMWNHPEGSGGMWLEFEMEMIKTEVETWDGVRLGDLTSLQFSINPLSVHFNSGKRKEWVITVDAVNLLYFLNSADPADDVWYYPGQGDSLYKMTDLEVSNKIGVSFGGVGVDYRITRNISLGVQTWIALGGFPKVKLKIFSQRDVEGKMYGLNTALPLNLRIKFNF